MTAGAGPAPLALEVEGLAATWPDGTRGLERVDLRVAAGERLAVLGANGAGKSTLLLALAGFVPLAAGRARVLDVEVGPRTARAVRERLGLVFQDPDDMLFCGTVGDDVAFGPRNLGLDPATVFARVSLALAQVGLDPALAARAPQRLSAGEKRRAALAAALAQGCPVLALDEPTSTLDPRGRRRLIETLAALDRTLLVVTHDLELARALCPRAVVLERGRTVHEGPTAALLDDPARLAALGL